MSADYSESLIRAEQQLRLAANHAALGNRGMALAFARQAQRSVAEMVDRLEVMIVTLDVPIAAKSPFIGPD